MAMTGSGPTGVKLQHARYTSLYSTTLHYPIKVEWWETRNRVGCTNPLPRKDAFGPDPQLVNETNLAKDYVGSGLDRGHMCPAADNECGDSRLLIECFYFSNMAPQYHSLNAGDWKKLEERTRHLALQYDSVMVWCGSVGSAKRIGTTTVPTKCWKVIYVKSTKTWECYIFNNTPDKPVGLPHWSVNKDVVEKLTGYTFVIN